MDGTGHLLSLKVMRVSRPSLASAWEPFYSSSPSFSAHSTASLMSLQGKDPLPGHPKTLRDLTHISEVLMLPSSFGAIQLGETFTSCLAVNNDSSVEIDGVTVKVEMQTATTKTLLLEFGGASSKLPPQGTLERVVHHEIKELGQHVLGCTVSYRLPPGARPAAVAPGDTGDPSIQTFRKFYKFSATNPLSVKTKVHMPRAPSALLSRTERDKVFLEVHIQNLTQDAMWLERMQFECVDHWQLDEDSPSSSTHEDIFSGSMALMQPQDMRQYIYTLSPKILAAFPVSHTPGSSIALGRLDISWRSSFGEPGRLLTSILSRRIPLVQATPQTSSAQVPLPPSKVPASAIPLHLQRTTSIGSNAPSRPMSPQLNQRPSSPPVNPSGPVPYRPGSPFRSRTAATVPLPSAIQSAGSLPIPSPAAQLRTPKTDVAVDLVVRDIPRNSLRVEKPLTIAFTVTASASVPFARSSEARKQRVLSLVVQHIQPPHAEPVSTSSAVASAVRQDILSSRGMSPVLSTPSPSGTPFRGEFQDVLAKKLMVASPRTLSLDGEGGANTDDGDATPAPHVRSAAFHVELPPPYAQGDKGKAPGSGEVVFLGNSAMMLPPLRVSAPARAPLSEEEHTHERNVSVDTTDSESSDTPLGELVGRGVTSQDFEVSYLPMKTGFLKVGGLRILLVEDRLVDESEADEKEGASAAKRYPEPAITLKEWEVVGEVWVKS